jgi:hypothetical protein
MGVVDVDRPQRLDQLRADAFQPTNITMASTKLRSRSARFLLIVVAPM